MSHNAKRCNKKFTFTMARGKKKAITPDQVETALSIAAEKKANGRPPVPIDPKLLFKLAQSMLPVESIATILGCHVDTIYSRFTDVLQRAREGRKKSLSMVMWEKALIEKDTKMMIWLSKQHLGYKDSMPQDITQCNFNVYVNEVPK